MATQSTSIRFSPLTRSQIDTLAALWGMVDEGSEGRRHTTSVIETAVTRALLYQEISSAGGSFRECFTPYHPEVATAILTGYMRDCVAVETDPLVRAVVYNIARRFGLTEKQADLISKTNMEG